MNIYNTKQFAAIKNVTGFDTKGILISTKNADDTVELLKNSILNSIVYDNKKSIEDNENDITLSWVNYGIPDFIPIKWATPKFKGINRPKFAQSNDPLPVQRITFTPINSTKKLSNAIAVNHIQEFCRENTIYDIRTNNGIYKQFNTIIDFGVIIVFCF